MSTISSDARASLSCATTCSWSGGWSTLSQAASFPLLLVASLAFAVLLTARTTRDDDDRVGFTVSTGITTIAALVFVLAVPQSQLRAQFPTSSLVYLEFFYLWMYVILLAVVIDIYLVGSRKASRSPALGWSGNLIPKVLYWPVLLAGLNVITLVVL